MAAVVAVVNHWLHWSTGGLIVVINIGEGGSGHRCHIDSGNGGPLMVIIIIGGGSLIYNLLNELCRQVLLSVC